MRKLNDVVLHIGLQVIEADVQAFYVEVLGFNCIRSFILPGKDADLIFDIERDVTILLGECEGFVLELFIADALRQPSFGHCCFFSKRLVEMAKVAHDNGYKTIFRGKTGKETLFLRDAANNVFEVKMPE